MSEPLAEEIEAREWLMVACETCGHWRKAWLTKDELADWFRSHGDPSVRTGLIPTTVEHQSSCPHPCGTPMADQPRAEVVVVQCVCGRLKQRDFICDWCSSTEDAARPVPRPQPDGAGW